MVRCLLVFAAVAVIVGLFATAVSADDKSDRDRRVRVALALADANKKSTSPAPRPAVSECYPTAYANSTNSKLPLVVWVGCVGHKVDGAVTVRWDDYPGVTSPACVVAYPTGDRMAVDTVLPCPAEADKLTTAIKSATRKADAKEMPGKKTIAPKPLDWKGALGVGDKEDAEQFIAFRRRAAASCESCGSSIAQAVAAPTSGQPKATTTCANGQCVTTTAVGSSIIAQSRSSGRWYPGKLIKEAVAR